MTRYWTVPTIWEGQTVAVMASGPSMSPAVAAAVSHLPRIVVNTTYRLAPDADIIYASDAKWWHANGPALRCPGLKVSIEKCRGMIADNLPSDIMILRNTGREGYDHDPGAARTINNSGAVALQIAVKAGAARVLLFGFDMRGQHWHGPHDRRLGNPSKPFLQRCVIGFRSLARALPSHVDVVNFSPTSALDCFRKASLEDLPR